MKTKKLLITNIILSVVLLAMLCFCLFIVIDIREAEASEGRYSALKDGEGTKAEVTTSQYSHVKNIREFGSSFSGSDSDVTTIMVYLNGCNLESDGGCATEDLREMVKAERSDQVNIVVQTTSTKEWERYNIASDRSQRYLVTEDGVELVCDNLGQTDVTAPEPLSDFISWTAKEYPADRYIMILWNHGGGSVDGYGYNEWGRASDALTIDEMQDAFGSAGVYFDIIGFDACIMSSLEVCYSLYDYCDYMIVSEDFESGLGWYYTDFLTELARNPGMDTVSLGKLIVDDMVKKNEENRYGCESTLALIDERYIPELFNEWKEFAYDAEEELLHVNYSREVVRSSRAMNRDQDLKSASEMEDYYITDLMALASSVNSNEAKTLINALKKAIVYYNYTDDDKGLTGMFVTIPYDNISFYRNMKGIYIKAGIDRDYIMWLKKFADIDSNEISYYDYGEFESSWDGWDN